MSILTIAIVLIFLIDEILAYKISGKDYSRVSSPVAVFEVKKWVTLLTFLLFIIVNGMIIYFKELLTVYDIIFMIVLDTTVLVKLYKSVGSVRIYDEGILVKGIFIHWDMIDDITEYDNGNYLISSQHLSGSSIKTGIIIDGDGFKKLSHEKYIKSRSCGEEESEDIIDKPLFGLIADIIRGVSKKD